MALPTASLQRASFKGAAFFLENSDFESGRKTVTFEYPNQDTRSVQDLGLLPPVISIMGIVSSNNYYADRNALINALSTPGAGILVHPLYGSITVTALPFNLNENIQNLGIATFSMRFETSSAIAQPSLTNTQVSQVSNLSTIFQSNLILDFNSVYGLVYNSQVNFEDAVTKSNNIAFLIQGIIKSEVDDLNSLNILESQISNYLLNVPSYIYSVSQGDIGLLSSQIQGLLNQFSNSASTPEVAYNSNIQLFSYGSTDGSIVYIPMVQKAELITNNDMTNSFVIATALSNAYANAVLVTYETEVQLNDTLTTLEDTYQLIIQSPVLSPTTKNSLEDLRVQVINYFNTINITIAKLINITVNPIPLTVLTYQYYNNLANLATLDTLNQLYNPANTSGPITILSET